MRGSHILSAFRNAAEEGSIATFLFAQAPFQRPLDEPCTYPGMASAVNHTKNLPGIQINDCCHPRLDSLPD